MQHTAIVRNITNYDVNLWTSSNFGVNPLNGAGLV